MHAIVMVHKMQTMTLSNHQLLPNKQSETASRPTGELPRVPVQYSAVQYSVPVHYKAQNPADKVGERSRNRHRSTPALSTILVPRPEITKYRVLV